MDIERIKTVLKQNKITYEKLSELTGLSLGAIRKIMCGSAKNPRYETIKTIEKALNISEPKFRTDLANPYYTTNEEKLIKIYRSIPDEMKDLFLSIAEEFATDKSKSDNKQIEKINLRRA